MLLLLAEVVSATITAKINWNAVTASSTTSYMIVTIEQGTTNLHTEGFSKSAFQPFELPSYSQSCGLQKAALCELAFVPTAL